MRSTLLALSIALAAPAARAESTGVARAVRVGWGTTAAPGELGLELTGNSYDDDRGIEGGGRHQAIIGVGLLGGLPWGFELSAQLLPFREVVRDQGGPYGPSYVPPTTVEHTSPAWGSATLAWRVGEDGLFRFRLEATGGKTFSLAQFQPSTWTLGAGGAATAAVGPLVVDCRFGILATMTGDTTEGLGGTGYTPYMALRTSVVFWMVSIDPELSIGLPTGPLPTLFSDTPPTVVSLGLRLFPTDWMTLSASAQAGLDQVAGGFGTSLTLRYPGPG